MGSKRHKHIFSALYWYFGPYGDESVHVHNCIAVEDCSRVLIGEGRECDGKAASHHRVTLNDSEGC